MLVWLLTAAIIATQLSQQIQKSQTGHIFHNGLANRHMTIQESYTWPAKMDEIQDIAMVTALQVTKLPSSLQQGPFVWLCLAESSWEREKPKMLCNTQCKACYVVLVNRQWGKPFQWYVNYRERKGKCTPMINIELDRLQKIMYLSLQGPYWTPGLTCGSGSGFSYQLSVLGSSGTGLGETGPCPPPSSWCEQEKRKQQPALA